MSVEAFPDALPGDPLVPLHVLLEPRAQQSDELRALVGFQRALGHRCAPADKWFKVPQKSSLRRQITSKETSKPNGLFLTGTSSRHVCKEDERCRLTQLCQHFGGVHGLVVIRADRLKKDGVSIRQYRLGFCRISRSSKRTPAAGESPAGVEMMITAKRAADVNTSAVKLDRFSHAAQFQQNVGKGENPPRHVHVLAAVDLRSDLSGAPQKRRCFAEAPLLLEDEPTLPSSSAASGLTGPDAVSITCSASRKSRSASSSRPISIRIHARLLSVIP